MNKLIIIAAVGKNSELGRRNDLIWHIKEDLNFFKSVTMNHHMLMGKNTYLSLPKLLPGRTHMVLTTKGENSFPKEVICIRSLAEFNLLKKQIDDDIYVIGGASVYNEMINYADYMLLTLIDDECLDADVYFPKFNDELYEKEVIASYNDVTPKYKRVLYKRKK